MSRLWLLGAGLAVAIVASATGSRALGDEAAKKAPRAAKERSGATSQASAAKGDPAHKPPRANVLPLSVAQCKIEQALAAPTQLEFIETPLSDVVEYLKDYHEIERGKI